MRSVGIVRSKEKLEEQKNWLDQFRLQDVTGLDSYSVEEINAIFMYVTASLITEAALCRTESRGGHFRRDFPFEDDQNWYKKQIIQKRKGEVAINYEHIKTALVN
ncbi:MAG TPA: hypothetical protein VFH42_06850 [Sporolactobacillaceae bacterium]|nr:hypothetical protein [Sporolactobacillaceae bacterium]